MRVHCRSDCEPVVKGIGRGSRFPEGAGGFGKRLFVAAFLALGLAVPVPAQDAASSAQRDPLEKALKDVGATEHLDAPLPLDLAFCDSLGRQVTLREFFDGTRPVILTMNYSRCPRLCSLQLNGLFTGLGKLDWDIGQEFQMVTVSIDPEESTRRAHETRLKYLESYGRENTAGGWHYLTGKEENIRKLADVVGFAYVYVPETREFAHAAVLMVCTPEGRISRYLYGIEFDARTLRLALVEASEGKIGTTTDRVLLYCFHYDAATGRYGPAAMRLMQLGSAITVVLLGGTLLWFWRHDRAARLATASMATSAEKGSA